MKDFNKKFIVKQYASIKLNKISSSWKDQDISLKQKNSELVANLQALDELQYLMYAENKHSLLIILQGLDAAGKDGVIRNVITAMNPQGCKVKAFKKPTAEELSHDFLWRVHPHSPRNGEVVIFNRSQYEDVLHPFVHKMISEKQCQKRYDDINNYEKLLVTENKTVILKFFLNISPKEQLERFKHRLDNPVKHWKITDADYSERKYWNRYMLAYENLFKNTSTKHAPWYIIPSDHKGFRNLAISQIILETLKSLNMILPPSSVDIAKIRIKYHAALEIQNSSQRKPKS